jgi:hypothetical protein
MKSLNQAQKRSVSILGLKVEGISSKNTDNVRQALVILLQNNPQVFKEDKSPQEIIQMLEFSLPKTKVPQKRKGAELADYFRTHSMSAEAGKIMNEARKEFREGFAFKHDL